MIEKGQERAIKIPNGFSKLEYAKKIRRLNLTSLKDRRTRADIIEMYKIDKEN